MTQLTILAGNHAGFGFIGFGTSVSKIPYAVDYLWSMYGLVFMTMNGFLFVVLTDVKGYI